MTQVLAPCLELLRRLTDLLAKDDCKFACNNGSDSVSPRGLADSGRVLFVYSVPFRCQLDREQGFRQVLRSEFPNLVIDERVASDESSDVIYEAVRRDIDRHGPATAIYNVSGANTGIGRALEDEGLASQTIFVGDELNKNSRLLLERGTMDMAIGHDFDLEIFMAVECTGISIQGKQPVKRLTQSQIFMRYNCANY